MSYINAEMVARICDLPADLKLSSTEFAFLVVVARHVRRGAVRSFPGVKRVCMTARISEKTYQRTLASLKQKGLLTLETLGRKRLFILTLPNQSDPPCTSQDDDSMQDRMTTCSADKKTSQKLAFKFGKKKEAEDSTFLSSTKSKQGRCIPITSTKVEDFDVDAYLDKCLAERNSR